LKRMNIIQDIKAEFRLNRTVTDTQLLEYYIGQAEAGIKEFAKFANMKHEQHTWTYQ